MADITSDSAATKVYDYAHFSGDASKSENLRQEVIDQLKSGSSISGFDDSLNQKLIDSGTLPDLLVKDWSKLDTDGSNKIEYAEVLAAAQSDDPLVRMLGQNINDNKIPNSIDPETMYPTISLDTAKADAQGVPETRPIDTAAGGTPPATPEAKNALSDLQNPNTSAEQKLKDIQTLVKSGLTSATIADTDGQQINVKFDVTPIKGDDSKSFIHMYAVEPSGKQRVIMRGIADGDNILHEKDRKGRDVGFYGSKWSKLHDDGMYNN